MSNISGSLKLAPPWSSSLAWQEVNQVFDYLIRLHRPELHFARALAGEIKVRLESIFPLMDELCLHTCPRCPEPCCLVAKVWIDFPDLLFMHLTNQHIPSAQLVEDLKETCRYMSLRGCRLPRISRPWPCSWYLCPPQKTILRQNTRLLQDSYSYAVRAIRVRRNEMEAEFILVVS
jgi:hypothetical protein